MILQWSRNGVGLEAFGHQYEYRIRAHGLAGCVLQAFGYDGVTALATAPYGIPFQSPQMAKNYAQKLDRVKAREPQLGGE